MTDTKHTDRSTRGFDHAIEQAGLGSADMLAALKEITQEIIEVYWCDGETPAPPPACIVRARAAIAKAEGNTP